MNIAIIGCGNIGSRHLQGLVSLPFPLNIQVVEPVDGARTVAQQRYEEALKGRPSLQQRVEWLTSLDGLKGTVDATIVATQAAGRASILKSLLQKGHRRFIVEKVVCQSAAEFDEILALFKQHGALGWVNCVRRYWPFYRDLIKELRGKGPVYFNVLGGNVGLGCNAIHYFDIFSALVEDPAGLSFDGGHLHHELLANQRSKDLVEFAGTVIASDMVGNRGIVTFHPAGPVVAAVMIHTPDCRVVVDESSTTAFIGRKENGWKMEPRPFQEVYTSTNAGEIVADVVQKGECLLPTLLESSYLHKELFRVLGGFLEKKTGKSHSFCPIT